MTRTNARSLSARPWTGTYRLQLHAEFPLARAIDILPYLKRLGVSHLYLSPVLQATPGSRHGYDVTDASSISADIGGEEGWSAFVHATNQHGLGILLDIVPNHMAATAENSWWQDILWQGPYSPFREYFDVRVDDTSPFRIHLCTLGRAYGDALKAGEFKLEVINGLPRVHYGHNSWPLAAASWGALLTADALDAPNCFTELCVLQGISRPSRGETASYERHCRDAKARLLASEHSGALGLAIKHANANPEVLDSILAQQFFDLHSWALSGELTNFRRFFEVDSLVGICTEREAVFDAMHARIAKMVHLGELDGLRVDHPDGLADPKYYFERLRSVLPDGRIYVEKILESDERLDESWRVDGTVGYDFLAKVNRLWMDDSHTDALTSIYNDFTGHSVNVGALVRQKQREVLNSAFFGDLNRLSQMLIRIARGHYDTRDLSPRHLRDALAAFTVALPVYRTYRTYAQISAVDVQVLQQCVQVARLASPEIDSAIFDFLEALFCKAHLNELEAEFVTQWQQLTPAVMAKGVEDTTFYVFDRLLSCNEVGSSASMLGISSEKFHEYCHYLSEHWPQTLLATSTHDNKRSEDVRTRISLLSEIPERWAQSLDQWSRMNVDAWRNRNPDRHAEYLLYQTMIGAWPISQERCWQYMLKALREAKITTSWHKPNPANEEKMQIFTENVFGNQEFIASLESFVTPLVRQGQINSLAQTLIKMIAPGVPDFYQGAESWDLSLVDPDNRRPVDYSVRARLLSRCDHASVSEVLDDWESGLPKLWMISKVLKFRARHPHMFASESKYQPLTASGSRLSHLFACRRGADLIAIVPRFGMSIAQSWQDTQLKLPAGEWIELFSGVPAATPVSPAPLFARFPVALLVRKEFAYE